MQRIPAPTAPAAKAQELLTAVQSKLGLTPNLMKTMAQSPVVLEGYLNLSSTLAKGHLNAKLREQIAIAVAESNQCGYCLAAHTALGAGAGLTSGDLSAARSAQSADPKIAAALQFAQTVNRERGHVSDTALDQVRQAGYTDAEISEIVAHVGLNVLTNYFNSVAQTEIDFPKVL